MSKDCNCNSCRRYATPKPKEPAMTTTWTKGDDTAALIRLLGRAAEAEVRVTAVYAYEDWGHAIESVPDVNFEGEWTGRNYYITQDMTPVSFLVSVTSPLPTEPIRPDWLPEGVEDGDWLVSGDGKSLARWDGSTLIWINDRPVVEPRIKWRIWPVWAEVKAERERSSRSDSAHDAYREGLEAKNEALLTEVERLGVRYEALHGSLTHALAEVERLSTVTDEMVEAGISAATPMGHVRDVLNAALAKRDEGQS